MRKYANLIDLENCFPMNIYLQRSASIQPRTSLLKFILFSSCGIQFSPSCPARDKIVIPGLIMSSNFYSSFYTSFCTLFLFPFATRRRILATPTFPGLRDRDCIHTNFRRSRVAILMKVAIQQRTPS